MNPSTWTCQETDQHFPAYRLDALAPEQAEALFLHILACNRCHARHFQPAREESELMMNLLLNAMEAPEAPASGQDATLTGGSVGLSLAEWTSSGQLDLGLGDSPPARPLEIPAEEPLIDGPHLRQVGILLPPVPRKQNVSAYWLYLGDGLPRPDQTFRTRARLYVTEKDVSLEALGSGVVVDGQRLPEGSLQPLSWAHVLEVNEQVYLLQRSHGKEAHQIGLGFLRFGGSCWPLDASLTVGRGAGAQLPLPNRELGTNLRIETQGSSPSASVFLDAVSVSREHALLTRGDGGTYRVEALGRFPVWWYTQGKWKCIEKPGTPQEVAAGDELLIGQTLFQLVVP